MSSPPFSKNASPLSSLYGCKYTNRAIPACRISLEQSLQGECVRYNVAPAALLVERATFIIAFASACRTYQRVNPFSSSQSLGNPVGVPLYPSLMIIPSLTISAPTCLRLHLLSRHHSRAMRMYARSYRACFVRLGWTKVSLLLDMIQIYGSRACIPLELVGRPLLRLNDEKGGPKLISSVKRE